MFREAHGTEFSKTVASCSDAENLFPVETEFPCRGDVAVEGLAGDTEFFAQLTDLGTWLTHGRHGEQDFGWGHFVGSSIFAATSPR